jgi:hypothetical protein
MSDYLSNLVARSFDLGEVVQPRPVSLFEPTPVPSMPTLEEPGSPETGKEPILESPGDETPRQTGHVIEQYSHLPQTIGIEGNEAQEKRDPPEPTPNQMERSSFTRELPAPGIAPLSTPQSKPVTNQQHDGSNAQPPRTLLVTSPMSDSPSSEPIIREVLSMRESYRVLEPVFPPLIAPANEGPHAEIVMNSPEFVTVPAKTEREERPDPEPVGSGSETVLNQPSTMLIAVQPQITAFEESPKQRQIAPAGPPEAAPTIHVTIGRLEVRATPQPSPPQKEKHNRAPVMSLDEYLRQRSQGSGR